MSIFKSVVRKLDPVRVFILEKYYHFLAQRVVRDFDHNLFKDKRVAIIGGADSATKDKLGGFIDGFDIVVRINKGVEMVEKYQDYIGQRTDVLFHTFEFRSGPGSSPVDIELWHKKGVKYIIFSFNINSRFRWQLFDFVKQTKGKKDVFQMDQKSYERNFEVITPFNPTNGFIALNTVFNCSPKELYVTGITFFKTPHNADYRKEDSAVLQKIIRDGNHSPETEYRYFKQLYNNNTSIIKPDAILKAILETN